MLFYYLNYGKNIKFKHKTPFFLSARWKLISPLDQRWKSISVQELRHDKVLQYDRVRGIADLFRALNIDMHVRARVFIYICACMLGRARFIPPFAEVYLGMAARFRGWIAASPTVNFAPRRIFVGDYSPRASKIRDDETEHHRVSFGRLAGPGEWPRSFPEFRWDTSPGRSNARTTDFSALTSRD